MRDTPKGEKDRSDLLALPETALVRVVAAQRAVRIILVGGAVRGCVAG